MSLQELFKLLKENGFSCLDYAEFPSFEEDWSQDALTGFIESLNQAGYQIVKTEV